MSRKHDKKKAYRSYGGDAKHVERVVTERRNILAEWIERHGGAEKVHLRHLSAIVAAKPRRVGRITPPSRHYDGATIEEHERVYVITPPQRRGLAGVVGAFGGEETGLTDKVFFNEFVPQLGGMKFKLLVAENRTTGETKFRTVYVLPKTAPVASFVRKLSVFWG